MEKIISGKTIDDAVEQACAELKLDKSELRYEIVEMEKKGFLGLGSKPALIKVIYSGTPERYLSDYIKGFFALLGITEYEEEINLSEDGQITVQLNGDALEEYTGKGCNIVDSLQYLLVMSLNKQSEERYRLTLNINDYKEKSAERLKALAQKTAKKVLATKRKYTLTPMSSFQRRIIHSELAGFDENITTYSVGEEPNRKVVVAYTGSDRAPAARRSSGGPNRRPGRRNGGYNRGGSGRDRRSSRPSTPKATTTGEPFKMTQIYPKPASERDNSAFKIDE